MDELTQAAGATEPDHSEQWGDGSADIADLDSKESEEYQTTGELPERKKAADQAKDNAEEGQESKPAAREKPMREHERRFAELGTKTIAPEVKKLEPAEQTAIHDLGHWLEKNCPAMDKWIIHQLADADNPLGILRHLASDRELVQNMARMRPADAEKILDDIDRQLEKQKPRQVSRAKRPPSEVGGRMGIQRDAAVAAANNDDYQGYADEMNRRDIESLRATGRPAGFRRR